jgi:plasmid maintenance system antidote protein VapI
MALRLSRYFGTSPDTWIGLQSDYDLLGFGKIKKDDRRDQTAAGEESGIAE